ncbi:MAG TPA: preprotein translocase subunit SecE [Candidatus Gemmiger avistercoris]|uniref:Protein translocase subunit SecE n=1 Tax=Candidatus Gemmiger avistercoris TaxID=2838606 RepID=A0A9D2FI91_9FIRM|nr:preprotein translocase subunit SecE [uncultured Subdoligranulum sp.]HIZ61559.1 preprotein translocase subunit SecE [Candidatus Gemmiger avistercoris]
MADKKAAKTAAQAQSDKKKKTSFFGKVKNFFKGIAKYFKDTKSELKKVVWPSKKDVKTNTITVIAVVVAAAIVLIVLDLIFGGAIQLLIGA